MAMKLMPPMFRTALALVVASLATASIAQDGGSPSDSIVVIGKRSEQAEVAAEQAKDITLKPTANNPLPRRYAPICLKLFGIDPNFGAVITEQVYQNVRTLRLPVAKPGCQPNVWIGFVGDSKNEVKLLRKREPAMFAELKDFEVDRIFAGSGAAQVWNSTEIRSADGRSIPIVQLNIPLDVPRKVEAKYNAGYQGGRLVSPIRSDINGTIVVFDSARANGKTVQQLADYATLRILAPVQDYDKVPERAMPTILTLFTPGADPPEGLTEFDWAYLSAYYKLDSGAKASAVHDSVRQAVLDGTGQSLRERSAGQ